MKRQLLSAILIGTVTMSMLSGCNTSKTTYDAKTVLSASNYDVTEYVELADLSQVDISTIDTPDEISDEYTKSYLDYTLQSYPDYTVSDHSTIQEGDAANIDYVGTIDGNEFDGGSAEDYYLEIGSSTFIDGFETGLIGHKKGDKVSLDLSFPDDYENADYAGKPVNFQVTINGIYDVKYLTHKTVTDDYISENFGYDTVDSYLAYLKEYLTSSSEYNYKFNVQNTVIEQLEEGSKIEIPDGLVDSEIAEYKAYYTKLAEEENQTLDEFFSENLGYDTFDEYKKDVKPQIESKVKNDLIFQALALELEISFSEQEFNDFVKQQMEYNNLSEEDLYMQYGGSREKTMITYLESMALDKFTEQLENVTKTDTEDSNSENGSAEN